MNVEFYFDPACPWCWITSRWLHLVSNHRDLTIDWKPFSLALKNDDLNPDLHTNDMARSHQASHRILRVIVAATQKHERQLDELYTAFGIPHHTAGFAYDDDMIRDVLTDHELPADLVAAADDPSYDETITQSMNDAFLAAGDDIGVPTIVFINDDGNRVGYFGPVLTALPNDDESLKLWDGLSQLATSSHFYELKRSRKSSNGPDTASTARC